MYGPPRDCKKSFSLHKPLAQMIRHTVEAFIDVKLQRADISVALYQVSADVGGPALIKRTSQRVCKAIDGMLGDREGYKVAAR